MKNRFSPLTFLRFLAGWLAIGLGIAGIFLPILPTTPFLLLAAYCFSKSSPRFHRWLIHHPYLGSWIEDYLLRGGLTRRRKWGIILLMWSMILLSLITLAQWWATLLLLLLGGTGTVVILSRKTIPPDSPSPNRERKRYSKERHNP